MMNATAIVDDAITLNRQGLEYLFLGDDEKAIASLTKSIMLVQKWAQLDSEVCCRRCTTQSNEFGQHHRRIKMTSNIMQPTVQSLQHLNDNMFYIYNRPITILEDNSTSWILKDIQQNGNDAIREYSACIIFNVALAYHRHGMKHLSLAAAAATATATSGSSSPNSAAIGDACIQKAKTLYCTIIKLLCVVSSKSPLNMTHKSSMVVFLAAHNNLSQILRNVGQYDLANEGMQCIATLVDQLREQYYETTMHNRNNSNGSRNNQNRNQEEQQEQQQQQQKEQEHHQRMQFLHLQEQQQEEEETTTTTTPQQQPPTKKLRRMRNSGSTSSFQQIQKQEQDNEKEVVTMTMTTTTTTSVLPSPPSSPSVDIFRECIDGVERNLLVISCAAAPVA